MFGNKLFGSSKGSSKKVILLGRFGVGKTSLIERYVRQEFSELYITTIGVKIDKKIVSFKGKDISLIIWDIAGEDVHLKVPKSYKLGAHGVIYVFDLTMPSSYENLEEDIAYMKKIVPPVPFVITGNKLDLINKEELEKVKEKIPKQDYIFTSAKSGNQVEDIFTKIVELMTT